MKSPRPPLRRVLAPSLLLLLLAMICAVPAPAQWIKQYVSIPVPFDPYGIQDFRDIDIVNDSVLIAITGTTDVVSSDRRHGYLLRSTNSGESWSVIHYDTAITYLRLQFLDERIGYMIAQNPSHVERYDSHLLLKTTDGGASWSTVYRALSNGRDDVPIWEAHYIHDLYFSSPDSGFIAVDDRPTAGDYAALRRTTDGGATWSTVVKGNDRYRYPESHQRHGSLSFPTPATGFMVTSIGILYRTTDSGATWDSLGTLGLHNAQFAFTSLLIGYRIAVTPSTLDFDVLYKTTDGGLSWGSITDSIYAVIPRLNNVRLDLDVIHFVNDTVGYLAGRHGNFGAGYAMGQSFFLSTRDGGHSWRAALYGDHPNFDTADVAAMDFLSEDIGWAVANGWANTGAIWHHPCVRGEITIRATGSTRFDQGDSVVLALPDSPDARDYHWSNGATTRTITARASGRYEGRIRFTNGCSATASVLVTANPLVRRESSGSTECRDCTTLGVLGSDAGIFAGCGASLGRYDAAIRRLRSHGSSSDPVETGGSASDSKGNIYLSLRESGVGSILLRYAPDGSEKLVRRIDRVSIDDQPRVAVDAADNVYFAYAGWHSGMQSNPLHLEKIGPDGTLLWTQVQPSPAGTAGIPVSIGFDGAGDIYVGSRAINASHDFLLQKFSPDSTRQWARTYSHEPRSREQPEAMAIDREGTVWMMGLSISEIGDDTLRVIVAYDRTGQQNWARALPLLGENRAFIGSDAQGGIYLGRNFAKESSAPGDMALVRLDTHGEIIWGRSLGGDSTDFTGIAEMTQVTAMAVDRSGGVYVAGPSVRGNRAERFDLDGRKRWSIGNARGNGLAVPVAAAVSDAGDLYLMQKDIVYSTPCSIIRYRQLIGLQPLAVPVVTRRTPSGMLGVIPNPLHGEGTITLHLDRRADVTLTLRTLLGETVALLREGTTEAGDHAIAFDAALPAGSYILHLRAGERIESMMVRVGR